MTTRVISTDLRTGARIAELEINGLRYGQQLNAAAPLSGTLPLPTLATTADAVRAATLNDAVDECRRLLIVERDGVIVGDGIVWASPYNDADQTRDIKAASIWSYFGRLYNLTRQTFTAVDQFTIARTLLTYALGKPGADIGITMGAELSGVLRDRTYERFDVKNIGEAVEQLAAVENGFDFAIDLSWDPATGNLVKQLNLANRRGRSFAQTGHVFEVGRNIVDFTWDSTGTGTANTVYAIGSGEGDSMMIAAGVDSYQFQPLTSGGPGYPLLEDVVSYKDVEIPTTLQGHANAAATARSVPVTLPKIRVRADSDPALGSYITGDACRLRIPSRTAPRFPDGLDTYRRIYGWDVQAGDEGVDYVDLTLGVEVGA